jgi:hypothetical protein
MTPARKKELTLKAWDIVAQEARHLADCADYDQVANSDEEDEFMRKQLVLVADALDYLKKKKRLDVRDAD